jgi:peroxiredoxin Q/BCP
LKKIIAFVLAALNITNPTWAEDTVAVGDIAPNFEMIGSDGKTHRLSDYIGSTVVIAWFPKAFTGG